MTELDVKTPSNQYNHVTLGTMGYQEIRNSAENWRNIMAFFDSGKALDLSSEPKKLNEPCIITGSGPSLDESIGKLKDWKGGVIAHYSQAVTLALHGVIPDYIVALDAVCNWEGLRCIDWGKTKTKLVAHPGVWPSLIENWPNQILFYRQNLGDPLAFGMNEQKQMYSERHGNLEDALATRVSWAPKITTELMMFACTPPAQLAVANVLQYGAVFLTGLDFCYHGDRERFTNYDMVDGKLVKYVHVLDDREYLMTITGHKTDPLHMYYKKNFLSACRLSKMRIFTTDKGAITEMPYVTVEKMIETQGRSRKWDIPLDVRLDRYERYLASIGCYVVETALMDRFIECGAPLKDIPAFIAQLNADYTCGNCGAKGVTRDGKNHDGGKCQVCNQDKMKQTNPVDLEKNMKRIAPLVAYVEETRCPAAS